MATSRTVLFVARTLQATARLRYDVHPLLADDNRIRTLFVHDPTSRFGQAVPRFVDDEGLRLVSWSDVTSGGLDCDLVVSASVNPNLAELPRPMLVMSHGAGHHKFRAVDTGVDNTVSGLSPHQLLDGDQVIPTVIALGGAEQRHRLATACPPAADRATVTGDIGLDRLRRSLPHRSRYRQALGVQDGQRLVLLSSTWGRDSLMGRGLRFPAKLLEQLPADEFRVTAALHPNCWDAHSHGEFAGWLSAARQAGLTMIPPHEGWRAALIASDLVVADHGSVGFYAAALGKPLMLAAFGHAEIPPDSPAARLAHAAPRLDLGGDLTDQLGRTIADHRDDAYSAITGEALATTDAATRLRRIMYGLLGLDEPGEAPRIEALPLPHTRWGRVTAHHVYLDDARDPMTARRFPAALLDPDRARPFPNRVLVVDAAESAEHLRRAAPVLVWTESSLYPGDAEDRADEALHDLPNLEIVAVTLADGRHLVRTRRHGDFLAETRHRRDLATLAAVAHVRLLRDGDPNRLRYRIGETTVSVSLRRP